MPDPSRDDDGPRPRPGASGADSDLSSWYRMAGLGFEFIAAVGLCGGVGWWLDRSFGTRPWLVIVGCGFGFAVGLWQMIRVAQKTFRD